VGALRAEATDVDVSPKSQRDGLRVEADALQSVTCGQVVK
jgi:hypothetical protein